MNIVIQPHLQISLTLTITSLIFRLQKRIVAMEEAAVGEKPWQLTGEIAGPARPENSLLQEHLEYDTAARQAPVMTEEVSTMSDLCPSLPISGSSRERCFFVATHTS